MDEKQVLYAVLFAAVFAAGSWLVPAAYYSAAPAGTFVQVDGVAVSGANETLTVNATYTAEAEYPTKTTVTLYHRQNETAQSVAEWTYEGFIERGTHEVTLTLELDEPIQDGTYYIEFVITFETRFDVEKTYTQRTDAFGVVNGSVS